MSLIRFYHAPLAGFDSLFDDAFVTRLQPFGSVTTKRGEVVWPRIDIHESKDNNTVTAAFELPGLKPEDVTIHVHQDHLTVAGEAEKSLSHEEGGYAVRERSCGKFSRTLQLPFATKPDDVKAKMENGVLTVTFPKTNPGQQAQRIAIQ